MTRYDEERLGKLLRLLPPAPAGWLRAAQELPAARRSVDDLVDRAQQDLEFRRALLADLERTLAQEGVEPDRALVDELRRRFTDA